MAEKLPERQLPELKVSQTPQEKLEVLLNELGNFSKPPYDAMDEDLVTKMEANVWARIQELKKEYPELNN